MPEYKSPLNGAPLPRGKPFERGANVGRAQEAGRASGRRRRQLKTMREDLLALLSEVKTEKSGKKMTVQAGITAALVKEALNGNTKAYEIIRDGLRKAIDHHG